MRLIFLLGLCFFSTGAFSTAPSAIDIWKSNPRGANMASYNTDADFAAFKEFGGKLLRFGATGSPGDFRFLVKGKGESETFDFSVENRNRIKGLMQQLQANGLVAVVTLADIPGRRWEFRKRDCRIWSSGKFQEEFINGWRNLAQLLKTSEVIIGYDLMNEPYLPNSRTCKGSPGSHQDLRSLYKRTVLAIREVDSQTPIILESAGMAAPDAMDALPVLNDERVFYSFHYYEPYAYYSAIENRGRLKYPGTVTTDGKAIFWDIHQHRKMLQPVVDWQKDNAIPSYRIFVGEFGVWRKAKGAEQYISDLTKLFNERGWAWAYYSFREDEWDNTDLEKVGSASQRQNNPLFQIIQREFQ